MSWCDVRLRVVSCKGIFAMSRAKFSYANDLITRRRVIRVVYYDFSVEMPQRERKGRQAVYFVPYLFNNF